MQNGQHCRDHLRESGVDALDTRMHGNPTITFCSRPMKLFYLPGSCALGPHIALEYSGLSYEVARVERGRPDPTYLAVNPLGRVPALVTATHGTITETPVVLSYIADVATDYALLPAIGTPERYQALRWMAYISSTVHPAFGRLWRAARFCHDPDCESSVEHAAAAQLADDFEHIDKHISNHRWIAGDHLSVADFHLFVFGRLGFRVTPSTRDYPGFYRHTMEIASLAATKSAMAQQGITLEGPATGPG
jgi:glutathione S-transferase